jgi:hypothetical protein
MAPFLEAKSLLVAGARGSRAVLQVTDNIAVAEEGVCLPVVCLGVMHGLAGRLYGNRGLVSS